MGGLSSSVGGPCGVTIEWLNSIYLIVGLGLTVVSLYLGYKLDYLLEDVKTEWDLDCILPNGYLGCSLLVLQCMLD